MVLEKFLLPEINEGILNPDYFFNDFQKNVLDKIKENYNLDWKLAGRSEEQADTFDDMRWIFSAWRYIYNFSIYFSIISFTT